MKLIIPAAGFGTRMNMAKYQAKELLPVESEYGRVIDWILNQVPRREKALVITRAEKVSLRDYVLKKHRCDVLELTSTKEWPDSLLQSEPYWEETNCLVLPDTRFTPTSVLAEIKEDLKTHDLVIATHEVDDVSKWGAVNGSMLVEKPNLKATGKAWGVLGFRKSVGKDLFQHCLTKQPFKFRDLKVKFIALKTFKDITRGEHVQNK